MKTTTITKNRKDGLTSIIKPETPGSSKKIASNHSSSNIDSNSPSMNREKAEKKESLNHWYDNA